MTADELRQQIELSVVELIKKRLADDTITDERAQAMSQHVLSTIEPGMSFDRLYEAIPKLDDTYPELAEVILPILRDWEENTNKKALENVRELIRQGQYDAATKLGKNTVDSKVRQEFVGSAKSDTAS